MAKKSRTITPDFTGVKSTGGGGGFHIEEGSYPMRVEEVEQETSKSGNDMLKWVFKGTGGEAKGKTFFLYTTLTKDSLWKLRQTLEALGQDIPDGPEEIDLDDLEGLECTGVVEDDEYDGKIRSKLVKLETGNGEETEEEDEAPVKAKKSNGKKAVKVSKEEVSEMDEDELENLVGKYSLDLDLGDYKTLRKKSAAVIEALDEGDHLEG